MKKVNICYAVDDNYSDYLMVSMYSLFKNRNRQFAYEILILYSELSEANRDRISLFFGTEQGVNISFVDLSAEDAFKTEPGSYLSVATYYRLFLLSDRFWEYDRILYLDCDTIIEGDVSELYCEEMEDKAIAAVEETGFRQLSLSKKAVFINGSIPYNVDNYRKDALMMKNPQQYFNAGVILFDLGKCREKVSYADAIRVLHEKKYYFNDQDVLNILFDGNVRLLDFGWNYQNSAEDLCRRRPDIYSDMYSDVLRESPYIIHYVSSYKPWKFDVALGDIYHRYEKEFLNEKT